MRFVFNPKDLFQDDGSILFASIYSEGNQTISRNAVSVKELPGLLGCHSIRLDDCGKVIAYWRNEPTFRAYGAELKRILDCGPKEFEGLVVDLRQRPKKRMGWLTIKNGLIAAAALFGALTVIQDYYARLFRPADVAVQFPDSAPIDVLDRSPVAIPYIVINEDRYAPAKVWTDSAAFISKAKPSSIVKLKGPGLISARLDPGSTISAVISGQAPTLPARQIYPEDYGLGFAIYAKEGMFWPESKFQAPQKLLHIWPRLGWNLPTLENSGETLCTLKGTIWAGRAYPLGVKGQVSTESKVPITVTVGMTVSQNPYPRGMSKRVTVLFLTEPLQAFSKYEYTVTIQSQSPLQKNDWLSMASALEVTLSRNSR